MLYGTIAGNIGKDPELKSIKDKPVLNFSVAARNGRKDETLWVSCSLWGERARKLRDHLAKGSKVTVMGPISTREYNGKTYLECDVQEIALQGGARREEQESDAPPRGRARSEQHDVSAEEIQF